MVEDVLRPDLRLERVGKEFRVAVEQALRGVADNLVASFSLLDPAKARKDSTGADPMAGMRQSLQGLLGSNMLSMMFARVENETALRALSNRDLMTRWFEAKSNDYLSEMGAGITNRLVVNREFQEQAQSGIEKMRSMRFRWEILGEIADGGNTTHIVYRLADDLPGEAGVLTFQKSGERWYIHFVDPNIQLGTMAGFALRAAQARMLRQ